MRYTSGAIRRSTMRSTCGNFHERGALMASFYVLSYLAFSVPAILAGLAIQRYGLIATTNGYASLQILAASLVLLLSLRTPAAQKAQA